ncbi:Translation elongation factor EF1B, gamma chain, conserved [Pseudocohnilembus persalinus]|uniref:Translation elongation factor EF1B, gamma chain, conserved n=1 Tax=Pseudocohnilembus persalinus TaxID=266149 RepID=A0A0V0Q9L8_PSEPJ|nr:Translation elongation factor EF1B, gamma chain, conserved [Pseudocohnilembus persalinus]|eukprot:KRW98880.1 Translation elongation factor EF1B, gamma chain, conserved [Pseudocohnilembus persalinus]
MLQCDQCSIEQTSHEKKIDIQQLFQNPICKINNFPPLKTQNKNQEKEIKDCLQNFTQQKILEYQNYVMNQIDLFYERAEDSLINSLYQQKLQTIQQFQNLFVFSNIEEIYNIEPLKQNLKQFEQKQINQEQLYKYQQKLKKDFEDEINQKIVLEQKDIQQEINQQLKNLQQQLDEKVDIFSQKIEINKDFLSRLCNNKRQINSQISENLQNQFQQSNQTSPFNIYNFKNFIVNEKNKQKGVNEFWKQFDHKSYSIWHLKYNKIEGEGEILYQTSNLKDAFQQKCEIYKLNAFGTFGVYGEEGNYQIEGVWVWKGLEIPEQFKKLPEFEYYSWKKLDHNKQEDKNLLEEFWTNMEYDKSVVQGMVARDVQYYK